MTESTLKEIVHRAVRDGSYRAQLQSDPASALAGISLTADERAALTTGDPARLTALGIDSRMSKAFAAGVLGDASKVIVVDPGAGGGSVIDEAAAPAMSPVWRVERDLDTAGVTADTTGATVDAAIGDTTPRPLEYDADAAASAEQPAASGMSPVWRVEQDLDTASAATDQPAAGPSHLQQIEQDLDTASAEVKDIDWPGEDQQTAPAARVEDAAGTEVTDLNQDANWDGGITPSEY